jgi:hypothetical protein
MHICSIPVANKVYDIELVEGRIFFNGKEHLSFTHHEETRIDISDTVPPENRPVVIAIAVAWAWRTAIRGLDSFPVAYDVNRDDDHHRRP